METKLSKKARKARDKLSVAELKVCLSKVDCVPSLTQTGSGEASGNRRMDRYLW